MKLFNAHHMCDLQGPKWANFDHSHQLFSGLVMLSDSSSSKIVSILEKPANLFVIRINNQNSIQNTISV